MHRSWPAGLGFSHLDSHGCFVKLVHHVYVNLIGETTLDERVLIHIVFGPLVCRLCCPSRGMSKGDANYYELCAQSGSTNSNL